MRTKHEIYVPKGTKLLLFFKGIFFLLSRCLRCEDTGLYTFSFDRINVKFKFRPFDERLKRFKILLVLTFLLFLHASFLIYRAALFKYKIITKEC